MTPVNLKIGSSFTNKKKKKSSIISHQLNQNKSYTQERTIKHKNVLALHSLQNVNKNKPVHRQSNLSLRDQKRVCKQRPTPVFKSVGSGLSRRFIPHCVNKKR